MLSMVCDWYLFTFCTYMHLSCIYMLAHYTMALANNNDHIIYFHMDATQSVRLAWTYFAHPDYLVAQCWVCTTYLSPNIVNQMGSQTYCYVKFIVGEGRLSTT